MTVGEVTGAPARRAARRSTCPCGAAIRRKPGSSVPDGSMLACSRRPSTASPTGMRLWTGAASENRASIAQRGDVAGVDALADPENQPGEVAQAVGGQHVAHLLPRGVHVALLVFPHHLGAEPGGGPMPGVDVQLAQPARLSLGHRVAPYRPASVDGRRHRLGLGRCALGDVGVGRVEQPHERLDEGRFRRHLGACCPPAARAALPRAPGCRRRRAPVPAARGRRRRRTSAGDRPCPATGRGTSRRASDSKSPAGPGAERPVVVEGKRPPSRRRSRQDRGRPARRRPGRAPPAGRPRRSGRGRRCSRGPAPGAAGRAAARRSGPAGPRARRARRHRRRPPPCGRAPRPTIPRGRAARRPSRPALDRSAAAAAGWARRRSRPRARGPPPPAPARAAAGRWSPPGRG